MCSAPGIPQKRLNTSAPLRVYSLVARKCGFLLGKRFIIFVFVLV